MTTPGDTSMATLAEVERLARVALLESIASVARRLGRMENI